MNDAINKTKAEIRARMRALLAAMTDPQRHEGSVNACTRLFSLEAFDQAQVVMLYMPLTNEVDITPAAVRCFRNGQTVCVPKVDWTRHDMDPVEVTSLDDRVLETDEHGVRVPQNSRPVMPGMIDLVVVPGLAFDPQGNRIGRGGGYYDRFLARLRPATTTVGLVFDQQIVDKAPTKPHDRPVQIVVTDRRISHGRAAQSQA